MKLKKKHLKNVRVVEIKGAVYKDVMVCEPKQPPQP